MTRLTVCVVLILFSTQLRSQQFGDLINFDAYTTSTVITDQYLAHGAIFSGLPAGHFADIYDYGIGSYGPVLKSDSWYDQVKVEFVDPLDAEVAIPIREFGFENPIDSEVDYVVANFYNESDELVFTATSISPEVVILDIDNLGATYVIFDDENESAYVLDDIWFEADTLETTNVASNSTGVLVAFPNPMNEQSTISFPEPVSDARIEMFDTAGRLVLSENNLSGNQYVLNRDQLVPGTYYFRIMVNSVKKYFGNITVK